jgi:YHS domain-containing protein
MVGPPGRPSSAPPAADPKVPPLALDGYCPVTLSEREQWAKGDARHGVIHRGRTYLFVGPDEAKRFFADPDRYAPVLSGMDVVIAVEENRHVPGKREYGAWYEGRVFLFAGDASYRKFDLDPGRYAGAVGQGNTITARRPATPWNRPPYNPDPVYPQYPPPARY